MNNIQKGGFGLLFFLPLLVYNVSKVTQKDQTGAVALIAEYIYRPDGLRHSKTITKNGVTLTHTHIWDGANIVAEIGATGTITARYIRGLSLIARERDGACQYYFHNAHGDVVQRIDARGNLLKNYNYDAFGNEQNPVESDSNPFRYCGEYWDKETETIYLRARNYDPKNGRFGAEDTHWDPDNRVYGDSPEEMANGLIKPDINAILESGNLYVYTINSPVRFRDQHGEKTVVFYYDNPDTGFEHQAHNSAYYDSNSNDVELIPVTYAQEFIAAWNAMDVNEVDDVYLYLHGGPGGLYFKGEFLTFDVDSEFPTNQKQTFSDLESKNIGGSVKLFSCYGAAGEYGENVAWMFHDLTKSNVMASTVGVSYSDIPLIGNVARLEKDKMFDGEWKSHYTIAGERHSRSAIGFIY